MAAKRVSQGRDRRPAWRRRRALTGPLALAISLTLATGAQAAFPGQNGRIAFDEYTGSSSDINSIDPSGANPQSLAASAADEYDPSYSAHGKRIVFDEILVGSASGYDIWRMGADGLGMKQFTRSPADEEQPSFSPNGKWIAFIHNADLWVMRSDGTHRRRIKNLDNGRDPSWSPNGKLIAYASGPSFYRHDIHVVRPGGTDARRLTHAPDLDNRYPDWSPSGRRILFSRIVGGDKADIYFMRPSGRNKRPLIATSYDEVDPAYSPNGNEIVYTSNGSTSGYDNIFRFTIATGIQKELSFDSHNESSPTWQPL
jgi:TolB protein